MLEGDRIRLRPLRKEDVDNFLTWVNDREVTRYLIMYRPMSRMAEEEWIEKMSKSTSDVVFVMETKEGEYLGNIGLHGINHREQNAELGIVIGNKKYWNNGFGAEAIKLILAYGFADLNLRRVYLRVVEENTRGIRCYEKCGFVEEGRLRDHVYKRGKFYAMIMMGILRSEFENL